MPHASRRSRFFAKRGCYSLVLLTDKKLIRCNQLLCALFAVDQSFQQNEVNGKTWHVLFQGRGMSGQLLRLYAAAVISLPGSSGSGVVPVGARLSFACSAANKQVN